MAIEFRFTLFSLNACALLHVKLFPFMIHCRLCRIICRIRHSMKSAKKKFGARSKGWQHNAQVVKKKRTLTNILVSTLNAKSNLIYTTLTVSLASCHVMSCLCWFNANFRWLQKNIRNNFALALKWIACFANWIRITKNGRLYVLFFFALVQCHFDVVAYSFPNHCMTWVNRCEATNN